MAALDFPANPTAGQVYEGENGVIYTYVGTAPNGHWSAFAELSSESFADIFVEVAGDNMTGDLTLGTDKITLKAADGTASYKSSVYVGGVWGTDDETAVVSKNGFGVRRDSGGQAFSVYQGQYGANGQTILFNADGSATFAGVVKSETYLWANASGSTAGIFNYQNNSTSTKSYVQKDTGGDTITLYYDGSGEFAGDVKIGGTIPSAPNISLKADGSISSLTETDIYTILAANDSTTKTTVYAKNVASGVAPVYQGFDATENTSSINNDGSASFAGRVTTQSMHAIWDANVGGAGVIYGKASINGTLNGYFYYVSEGNVELRDATNTTNTVLLADGSASFAGPVKNGIYDNTSASGRGNLLSNYGGFYAQCESTAGASRPNFTGLHGTATTSIIQANGTTKIGGTLPSAPNISLNAGGSAKFSAGVETAGTRTGTGTSAYFMAGNGTSNSGPYKEGVSIQDNGSVAIYKQTYSETGTGYSPCIKIAGSPDDATDKTVNYAVFGNGSTKIGGSLPNDPNIELDAAGNGNFKQRVAGGLASVASEGGASRVVGVAGYNRFDTVNPSGDVNNSAAIFGQSNFPGGRCWAGVDGSSGSILPTSEIFGNGSATFGAVDPNASDKVGVSWGVGGASITLKTQGTSAINGTLTNGYELFRGNIKVYSINYAGTSTFSNAILNLEADDDTKYTATTDADGEETLVYNGAVLDVKERLQKTDAALTALKSAAAAASDFAALKSAIATALADI